MNDWIKGILAYIACIPMLLVFVIIPLAIVYAVLGLLVDKIPFLKYVFLAALALFLLWHIYLGDYIRNRKFQRLMDKYYKQRKGESYDNR